MLKKVLWVMRWVIIRTKNIGHVSLPIHSNLGKGTNVYTSGGRITFGYGFSSSTNTAFSAVDGGEMIIGRRVVVNRNCIFICRKKIQIGNHCSFGPNVCIYDHDHIFDYNGVKSGYKCREVVIGDHCWIGAGAIILRGSHIGEGCIIGAGCIIKDDIPSHCLVTMKRELEIQEIHNE